MEVLESNVIKVYDIFVIYKKISECDFYTF